VYIFSKISFPPPPLLKLIFSSGRYISLRWRGEQNFIKGFIRLIGEIQRISGKKYKKIIQIIKI